eukprot:scaffold12.g8017.t1
MDAPAAARGGAKARRRPKKDKAADEASALPAAAPPPPGAPAAAEEDSQPQPSLSHRLAKAVKQLSQLGGSRAAGEEEEGEEVNQGKGKALEPEPAPQDEATAPAAPVWLARAAGARWRRPAAAAVAVLLALLLLLGPALAQVRSRRQLSELQHRVDAQLAALAAADAAAAAALERLQQAHERLAHQARDAAAALANLQAAQTALDPGGTASQLRDLQHSVAKLQAAADAAQRRAAGDADASAGDARAPALSALQPALCEEEVRQLARAETAAALDAFAADRTAQPDYALASAGGRVVAHSPALPAGLAARPWAAGMLGARLGALASPSEGKVHPSASKVARARACAGGRAPAATPVPEPIGSSVLHPGLAPPLQFLLAPITSPGLCLPLASGGARAYVDIRLARAIHPTAVTYEHIPASVAFDARTAPRNLTLLGSLGQPPPPQGAAAGAASAAAPAAPGAAVLLLGRAVYDAGVGASRAAQTFALESAPEGATVDHVRLQVDANHGGRYTCLYRRGLKRAVRCSKTMFALWHRIKSSLSLFRVSMSSTAPIDSLEARLFSLLFAGEQFSASQHAGKLAARLRELADSLDPPAKAAAVTPIEPPPAKRRRKDGQPAKEMDFGSYQQRYVALELLYLGHRYDGFARQDSTDATIEAELFAAMRRTRLVPPGAGWQALRYSRGGRTDKGVSALGQVVALSLRSGARVGQPALPPEQEIDYPSVLNTALPKDIRVTGWADVPPEFSARRAACARGRLALARWFSALHREYKYFIVQHEGEEQPPQQQQQHQEDGQADGAPPPGGAAPLDLVAMRAAAAHFVGEHDFRNFCKVDVGHVSNFVRAILEFRVEEVAAAGVAGRRLIALHIRGTAFLWHQVRCMAAVLLMVGRGEEAPDVVARLLDVTQTPRKPQYVMASEEALLLYACSYEGLAFRRGRGNQAAVAATLEEALGSHLVRAGMLAAVLQKLAGDAALDDLPHRRKQRRAAAARHVPLLRRATEPPLAARLQKAAAKAAGGGEARDGAARDAVAAAGAAAGAVSAPAAGAAAPSSSRVSLRLDMSLPPTAPWCPPSVDIGALASASAPTGADGGGLTAAPPDGAARLAAAIRAAPDGVLLLTNVLAAPFERADPGLAADLGAPLQEAVAFFGAARDACGPLLVAALREASGYPFSEEEARYAFRLVDYGARHVSRQAQACGAPPPPRCGAHRDFGPATVIWPGGEGSEELEVRVAGAWRRLPRLAPGCAVLLFGLCTAWRSNDRVPAAEHRVADAPALLAGAAEGLSRRRVSAVLFVGLCDSAVLAPALAPGEAPRYRTRHVGDVQPAVRRKWSWREGSVTAEEAAAEVAERAPFRSQEELIEALYKL